MKAILVHIVYLYLFIGCSHKIAAQKDIFDNFITRQNYSGMTLYVRYAECGEWGGHKEKIEIIDSSKKLFLTYKVFGYNCDSLDYYYVNDNPPILLSKSKFLDTHDLAEISLYIQRICQAKLEQPLTFHAGEVYFVKNANSTLMIRFYGFNDSLNKSYKKLLTFLFP